MVLHMGSNNCCFDYLEKNTWKFKDGERERERKRGRERGGEGGREKKKIREKSVIS